MRLAGIFAVILLDSGIWKALSFALMIVAAIAIGYKDLFKIREEDQEEKRIIKSIKKIDKNMNKDTENKKANEE